jgi:hypothetical protein
MWWLLGALLLFMLYAMIFALCKAAAPEEARCHCGRLYCEERAVRGVAAHTHWPPPPEREFPFVR